MLIHYLNFLPLRIEDILCFIFSWEKLRANKSFYEIDFSTVIRTVFLFDEQFFGRVRGTGLLLGEERAGSSCDFFVRLMFNARNVTADTSTWPRYSQDKCRRRSQTSIRETDSRTAMPVFSKDCEFHEILRLFSLVISLINLHCVLINASLYTLHIFYYVFKCFSLSYLYSFFLFLFCS